jgi:retron-type reverse transcriptase
LDALGRTIQQKRVSHVVEADIKSFFDEVNHEWMVKFLKHRIGDPRPCQSHGGRYPARVNPVTATVQHLPALCAGSLV